MEVVALRCWPAAPDGAWSRLREDRVRVANRWPRDAGRCRRGGWPSGSAIRQTSNPSRHRPQTSYGGPERVAGEPFQVESGRETVGLRTEKQAWTTPEK